MWNPKTGFMRTRMQVEQQQQQQQKQQYQPLAAAGGSTSSSPQQPIPKLQSSSSSSSGGGDGLSSATSWVTPLESVSVPNVSAIDSLQEASSSSAPASPKPPPAAAATTGRGALPDVSREQVLGSCLSVSAVMATAAAALHVFAQQEAAQLLGTEQAVLDQLLRLPAGFDNLQQAAYVPAAAGFVTAARMVLMQQWPDFAEATNRSNQQVLSPLGWTDVALVATFTGVTEELLFRGSLIPATLPDYRGVLLSGLLFGVLHVSGGRNIAFAVWATAVGWLYGAVFLATSNIWVAAGAHSLANFASAAIWKKNTARHHRL
jgi:membrane protease YdiL (CAAX protease family)